MENAILLTLGALIAGVLCLWLVVLPFRLSKGLLHKWGYHAHCGTNCDQGREAVHFRQRLIEEYKKGMRQGLRGALTFGPEESKKMLDDMNLLPQWARTDSDTPFTEQVKAKYSQIAAMTDATDDVGAWITALAVALGVSIGQLEDPISGFESAIDTVRSYGGLAEESQAT
jgi:hypothetical protein